MIDFVQNTLDGVTAGASYALLGVGFTLIFGVLRRANLSYGPAIMLGAYIATWTSLHTGAGLLVLFLVAVVATVLAGMYVERLCFAPHRKGAAAAAMVASFAIWMQLEELATLLLPRHLYAFPALYEGGPLTFGPFFLRVESLLMLLAAIVVLSCRLESPLRDAFRHRGARGDRRSAARPSFPASASARSRCASSPSRRPSAG